MLADSVPLASEVQRLHLPALIQLGVVWPRESKKAMASRRRARDTFVAAQRHADANDKKHKGKKEMTISQQPAIMREPGGELQRRYTNQTKKARIEPGARRSRPATMVPILP
jgi:hypothetical protein